MMRYGLSLALVLALAGFSMTVVAQEERVYTVAVFAPSVDFGDSLGKAAFVESVAQGLSNRSGLKFRGIAFARAGDFQSRAGAGKIDFAVLGGAYYAVSGGGKPIAYATGSSPLVLAARPGLSGALTDLRQSEVILPQPSKAMEGFITSGVLGHEISAQEFFQLRSTKDAQSALTAVKIGQADMTVVFEHYARNQGLRILYKSSASPLPVAVQVNQAIPEEDARAVRSAFQGLGVGGGNGLFSGFGGGGQGIQRFKGVALGGAARKTPRIAPPGRFRMSFGARKEGETRLESTSAADLVPLPSIQE